MIDFSQPIDFGGPINEGDVFYVTLDDDAQTKMWAYDNGANIFLYPIQGLSLSDAESSNNALAEYLETHDFALLCTVDSIENNEAVLSRISKLYEQNAAAQDVFLLDNNNRAVTDVAEYVGDHTIKIERELPRKIDFNTEIKNLPFYYNRTEETIYESDGAVTFTVLDSSVK